MVRERLFRGGEFLITDAMPGEVFTPEDFTKEHQMIARSAEEFGVGAIDPIKEELETLDPERVKGLLRQAGELGFIGIDIPEVYGGFELDKVSSTLITERISRGSSGFFPAFMTQTSIGSLPIVLFGSSAQKEKYLPKLASAETIGAYALTEPEHGSDALHGETNAVLSEDGRFYILNGQKQFITNAGMADLFLTYAQVDGVKFTSFIVERDREGVSLDREEKKMGLHGSSTRSVIFRDVRVPVENVLGEIGRGHVVALNTLNLGRFKLAANMLGICKLLIGDSIKWAKGRIQFGKPICEFGLIKHKIAEMVIRVYVHESMLYRTAALLDLALREIDPTKEDAGQRTGEAVRQYALECSINKVVGSETLDYVADECVQIMGGYGFIQDNAVERAYRDSRINRIWEGTNEINRLTIVDQLMKSTLKSEFPLTETLPERTQGLPDFNTDMNEEEGSLHREQRMLGMAKRVTVSAIGSAAQKFAERLSDEQEVAALAADMIMEVFSMESALLRTLKKVDKEGEEKAATYVSVTQVYFNDAFSRVHLMAKQVFIATLDGRELETRLRGLQSLGGYAPINVISLRREIAESVIPAGRYHLSKV